MPRHCVRVKPVRKEGNAVNTQELCRWRRLHNSTVTSGIHRNLQALGALLVLTMTALTPGTAKAFNAGPTVAIVRPAAQEHHGGSLNIRVEVTSLFEVIQVTANLGGTAIPLAFSQTALCDRRGCRPGWWGTAPIISLPWGPQKLTVTAVDAFGARAESEVLFKHDELPEFEIRQPAALVTHTRDLRLSARVTNPEPSGTRLEVRIGDLPVAEATNQLDVTASLDAWPDYSLIVIKFRATNSAGRLNEASHQVRLVLDPRLEMETEYLQLAYDYQYDRSISWRSSGSSSNLVIRDRASGREKSVLPLPSQPLGARLTPHGALFILPAKATVFDTVYEWDGTQTIEVGEPSGIEPVYTLMSQGHFAAWNLGSMLILRDLNARTNRVVSDSAGNNSNDLAANGDLVYWGDSYRIHRHRAGVSTLLSNPGSDRRDTYPLTDGINVVWRRSAFRLQPTALWMLAANGESIELAPEQPRECFPRRDYQAVGGHVAFTRLDANGNTQVWIRDPNGTLRRVSFFSGQCTIQGLNEAGDLLILAANRTWLARSGQIPAPLILPPGQGGFWLRNDLMTSIDGAYFRVPLDVVPKMHLWAKPPRTAPRIEIWGPSAKPLSLQSSTHLTTWTDVGSFPAETTNILWEDPDPITQQPVKFYRLQER